MNFVHEIRTKFVIFDKFGKSSYEFARIREDYVTNGLYCTCSPYKERRSEYFSAMTISDENWNLKVHKNQCFINDQLHWVDFSLWFKEASHIAAILIQNYANINIFKFLKNCFRRKLELKSTQKSMFYQLSTPM